MLMFALLGAGSGPAQAQETSDLKPRISHNNSKVSGFTLDPNSGPALREGTASITPPSPPTGISYKQVSAAGNFTVAVGSDGHLYAWGSGYLGTEPGTDRTKPNRVQVPDDVTFTQVSTSHQHTLALTSDHHVYSWGDATRGELGRPGAPATPTDMTALGRLPATVVQVAAGDSYYSLALTSDHHVYAWGYAAAGSLGTDTGVDMSASWGSNSTPVDITAQGKVPATITALSAGNRSALALTSDHRVYGWGQRDDVDINSRVNERVLPFEVSAASGFPTNVVQIGSYNTWCMALTQDGHVYTWGHNDSYNLGNAGITSTFPNRFSDITAGGNLPATVTAIYGGGSTGRALTSDHHVYTWGSNTNGQLGNGTTANQQIYSGYPIDLTASGKLPATVTALSDGGAAMMAMTSDGKNYFWGSSSTGQQGTGITSITPVLRPILSSNPTVKMTSISFNSAPASKLSEDPTTGAWTIRIPASPVGTVPIQVEWTYNDQPQTPIRFSYYVKGLYTVHFNDNGANSTSISDKEVAEGERLNWPRTPTKRNSWFLGWFTDAGQPWDFNDQVTASMTLTAHWEDHAAFSISPDSGPAAGGTPLSITVPKAPQDIVYTSVTAGPFYNVAIGADGNVYSWGMSASGRLGNAGATGNTANPVRVRLPDGTHVLQVATGGQFVLALDSNHHVWAWGYNYNGQLGNGGFFSQTSPVDITAAGKLPNTVAKVYASDRYSFALTADGHVWAWGSNSYGTLTLTATSDRNVNPVDITALGNLPVDVIDLAAGLQHALAITSNHHVYSWGVNDMGQLGTSTNLGSTTVQPKPVDITAAGALPATAVSVSAGYNHSMALTADGHTYSWGGNSRRQLGDPSVTGQYQAQPIDLTAKNLLPATVSHIQAFYLNSLALTSSNHLYTWGCNNKGNLGNTTEWDSPSPNDITAAGLGPVKRASAGSDHMAAITTDNKTYTWGDNNSGQLGQGDIDAVEHYTPAQATAKQTLAVTDMTFGGIASAGPPGFDQASGKWAVNTPAHSPGQVSAQLHWTLGSYPQPDYNTNFTYGSQIPPSTFYTLPAAGSTPTGRIGALSAFALSASCGLVYAAIQVSRKRQLLHTKD